MRLVTNRQSLNYVPISGRYNVSKRERYALFILNKHESSYSDRGTLQNCNFIL